MKPYEPKTSRLKITKKNKDHITINKNRKNTISSCIYVILFILTYVTLPLVNSNEYSQEEANNQTNETADTKEWTAQGLFPFYEGWKPPGLSPFEQFKPEELPACDELKEDVLQIPEQPKEEVLQTLEQPKEEVLQTPEQSKEDVLQTPVQSKEDVLQTPVQSKEDVVQTPEQPNNDVLQTAEQLKEYALQIPEQPKEDVLQTSEQSKEGVVQTPEQPNNDVLQTAEQLKEYALQIPEQPKEDVLQTSEQSKEDVVQTPEQPNNDVLQTAEQLKEYALQIPEQPKEDVLQTPERPNNDVLQTAEQLKEYALQIPEQPKEDVLQTSEQSKEDVVQTPERPNNDVLQTAEQPKEDVLQTSEQSKEDVVQTPEQPNNDVLQTAEQLKEYALQIPEQPKEVVLRTPEKPQEEETQTSVELRKVLQITELRKDNYWCDLMLQFENDWKNFNLCIQSEKNKWFEKKDKELEEWKETLLNKLAIPDNNLDEEEKGSHVFKETATEIQGIDKKIEPGEQIKESNLKIYGKMVENAYYPSTPKSPHKSYKEPREKERQVNINGDHEALYYKVSNEKENLDKDFIYSSLKKPAPKKGTKKKKIIVRRNKKTGEVIKIFRDQSEYDNENIDTKHKLVTSRRILQRDRKFEKPNRNREEQFAEWRKALEDEEPTTYDKENIHGKHDFVTPKKRLEEGLKQIEKTRRHRERQFDEWRKALKDEESATYDKEHMDSRRHLETQDVPLEESKKRKDSRRVKDKHFRKPKKFSKEEPKCDNGEHFDQEYDSDSSRRSMSLEGDRKIERPQHKRGKNREKPKKILKEEPKDDSDEHYDNRIYSDSSRRRMSLERGIKIERHGRVKDKNSREPIKVLKKEPKYDSDEHFDQGHDSDSSRSMSLEGDKKIERTQLSRYKHLEKSKKVLKEEPKYDSDEHFEQGHDSDSSRRSISLEGGRQIEITEGRRDKHSGEPIKVFKEEPKYDSDEHFDQRHDSDSARRRMAFEGGRKDEKPQHRRGKHLEKPKKVLKEEPKYDSDEHFDQRHDSDSSRRRMAFEGGRKVEKPQHRRGKHLEKPKKVLKEEPKYDS
ncbi:Plasmodium exported protein, unknown function, partial [Plasmodium ovale]